MDSEQLDSLSDEQIKELERKIGQLPTIKNLKENDNLIRKDLEGLKKGQEELENDVRTGFEKGRKRMDGMELEMKEIKTLLINNKLDMDKNHKELKDAVYDDKFSRLEKKVEQKDEELKKKEKELDKEKDFWGKIKSGFILLIAGSVASYIAWTLKVLVGEA